MSRKIKSTDGIPSELIHQEGRHRGSLNQSVLQINGVDLVCGTKHPLCDAIVFAHMETAKGTQRWTTINREAWRKARNANCALARYHHTKQLKRDAN